MPKRLHKHCWTVRSICLFHHNYTHFNKNHSFLVFPFCYSLRVNSSKLNTFKILYPLNFNVKKTNKNLSGLRSEEHTSELQSRGQLVCRLLLEKKKRDREYKAIHK